jgi:hypothetical protein
MNNIDEILESIRGLLSNWNKPELKERWLKETKEIIKIRVKHSFIYEDNGFIIFRFMPQTINDITNIAKLTEKFSVLYRYHDEEGFLSIKIEEKK